jgi:hypothetical protein
VIIQLTNRTNQRQQQIVGTDSKHKILKPIGYVETEKGIALGYPEWTLTNFKYHFWADYQNLHGLDVCTDLHTNSKQEIIPCVGLK